MNNKILIIIGLPAIGKTTYANKIKDYIIFDDFVRSFYNGDVIEEIKKGNRVCLIDPRLCMFNVFEDIVKQIQKYETDIGLILFPNDPDKAKQNSIARNDIKKDNTCLLNCIDCYSNVYSLNNYKDYSQLVIQ